MGFFGQLMLATNAVTNAFREAFFASDPSEQVQGEGWGDWNARRARYAVYWAMVQNDVYRQIRTFANPYKTQYGLYRHTRGVYNPAARIVGFARSHIQGGTLDYDAGDGKQVQSALPIGGANAALRKAISRLWWDSNWQQKKGVYVLWGATFGDVGLRVCDEPDAGIVALDVVHPASIKWVDRDARGDVRAYVLQENRRDPRLPSPARDVNAIPNRSRVVFTEVAEQVDNGVQYRTYLDGMPFDWRDDGNGQPLGAKGTPAWVVPYPFVPFYTVPHIDIGAGWGQSELETGRAKIDEVNDLGSKLHDQIRRMVEGAWLLAGVSEPPLPPGVPRTAATTARPEPSRTELKSLYGPADARPWSLVGDLDIAATAAEIRQSLDNLEDDYPELRFERLRTGGDVSGEALRVARQPAAVRMEERRSAYDYALVQAQMAAVAIGGWRGYEGYQGFGLESYSAASPTHRIADRPVFATEPAERLAEQTARYAAVQAATDAGIPLELAMAEVGYGPAEIAAAVKARDDKAAQNLTPETPPNG